MIGQRRRQLNPAIVHEVVGDLVDGKGQRVEIVVPARSLGAPLPQALVPGVIVDVGTVAVDRLEHVEHQNQASQVLVHEPVINRQGGVCDRVWKILLQQVQTQIV